MTKELLNDYSFAYNRDGKIVAVKDLGHHPLIKWPMTCFFDYIDLTDSVLAISVRLDKVMEFTESLIIDSQYDFEIADSYFVPQNELKHRGTPFSVSDTFIDEINEYDLWISRYAEIRKELEELLHWLYNAMPMIDVFKGVLKDYILSEYYCLDGYLPERLNLFKEMADSAYNGREDCEGFKTKPINQLSERFRDAYAAAKFSFLQFFKDKEHLFAAAYAEDFSRYAISVYHSNYFWTD
ncbi:MAG: hypothetical protein NC311_14835 [Muribaculaceae bacterium]|nr:hypothetical protein [Muribaculaceae bacterium]